MSLEGEILTLTDERDNLLEEVKYLREENKSLLDKLTNIAGGIRDCYSTLGDMEDLTK